MDKLIGGLESIKVLFKTKAKQSENASYWEDFARITDGAIKALAENCWRDAEKEQPKEAGRYFVYDSAECVYPMMYEPDNEPDERWGFWESCWDKESLAETDRYWTTVLRDADVLYWMSIPEPPKGAESDG